MGRPILASYQGVACHRAQASRTPGWESDAYSVVLAWSSGISVEVLSRTVGEIGELGRRGAVGPGATVGAVTHGLDCVGDLVIHDPENGEPVVFQDLLVRDSGVRVLSRDEGVALGIKAEGHHLVELQLVDVRYLMSGGPGAHRGVLVKDFNLIDPRGNIWPQTAQKPGVPYSLAEIMALLLSALPGRLPIRRFPDDDVIPTGLSYRFDDPKAAAVALAEEHRIFPSLELDNSVSFWRVGEGRVGHGDLNAAALPETKLHRSFKVRGPTYQPDHVVVAGGPSRFTVKVAKWVPVAEDKDGKLAELDPALRTHHPELTSRLMGKLVLLPDDVALNVMTLELGLELETSRRLLHAAGRVWRMPDAEGKLAHLLPIEDRVERAEGGQPLAPTVESRSWESRRLSPGEAREDAPFPAAAPEDGGAETTMASSLELPKDLNAIADTIAARHGDPRTKAAGRVRYKGAVVFTDENLDNILRESKPIAAAQVAIDVGTDLKIITIVQTENHIYEFDSTDAASDKLGGAVEKAKAEVAHKRDLVQLVNLPLRPIDPEDYELDRGRGIITFRQPMGWITPVGEEGKERQRVFFEVGGVTVTFGFTRKPNPSSYRVSQKDYFMRTFELIGDTLEAVKGPGAATKFPLVVRDPSLVLEVALDKSSNIHELSSRAAELALDAVGRIEQVEEDRRLYVGSFPVGTNGIVTSVAWSMDPGSLVTEVIVGAYSGHRGYRRQRVTTRASGWESGVRAIEAPAAPAFGNLVGARRHGSGA